MPAQLTARKGQHVCAINPQASKLFDRGRALFLEEAKLLSTLKHPNIVSVLDFFLANGTAYLVMNYEYGTTLGHWLKNQDNLVDSAFLLDVFPPIMRCIKNMHNRNLLHLDIKPDNILLRPENNPLILDFGSAMPFKNELPARSHSMTNGYAAPEQHQENTLIGPWSDIYAIGASMRACLDRKKPPTANDKDALRVFKSAFKQYKGQFEPRLLQAIDWAMQANPAKRTQTIDDLLHAIHYL